MDDLISKKAAISAICNACGKIDCDKMDKCEKLQLPPANCSEFPNNSDTISRQAAIDGLRDYLVGKRCPDDGTLTCRLIENEVINKLPPIQPEIVRCEECKYHYQRNCPIEKYFSLDGFCSRGDRGTT